MTTRLDSLPSEVTFSPSVLNSCKLGHIMVRQPSATVSNADDDTMHMQAEPVSTLQHAGRASTHRSHALAVACMQP